MDQGEVSFTRMEKVIFGHGAAAVKAEAIRLGAESFPAGQPHSQQRNRRSRKATPRAWQRLLRHP